MRTDKLLVLIMAVFATIFSASSSHDFFQFLADYFAGAATCATLEYILEE